jgi:multidrug efflux pump subunit AcrB
VVFIPIAFLGGMAGQWFKPFGLTIACSVLVSLFVSFSLDPMLSAYWPDRTAAAHALVHQPLARLLQPVVRPPGRALQVGESPGRSTIATR